MSKRPASPFRLEDWTYEMQTRLIWEYRARPVLWDKSDKFFPFKGVQRMHAWKEISEILNAPEPACVATFRYLKSKLHRVHRNFLKNPSYVYYWPLYKEMLFLIEGQTKGVNDSTEANKAKTNEIEEPKIDFSQPQPQRKLFLQVKKGIVEPVATSMIVHHTVPPVDIGGNSRKVKPVIIPGNIIPTFTSHTKVPQHLNKSALESLPGSSNPERDNIHNFVKYLVEKLKTYSEENRLQLQHEINQALSRADRRESGEITKTEEDCVESDKEIIPDIALNQNNVCDESDTEPHTYEFLDSDENEQEAYNENDDLFEINENKYDVLLDTVDENLVDDDSTKCEDDCIELNFDHDYAVPQEKKARIKHEKTETDDED